MSEPVCSSLGDILSLLDSPIAFHRIFVSVTGSVTAALFLSQTVYWSKRTRNGEGWFYKSRDEWTEETGLSRFEQEHARKTLKKLGILEEKREGLPAKLFFRLVSSRLNYELTSLIPKGGCFSANKPEEKLPASRRRSSHLAGGISSGINKESETTPETTSKTTERVPPPSSSQANPAPPLSLPDINPSTNSSPKHTNRDYQKSRFTDWIKKNWETLQDDYLPCFQNDVVLLRWSLNNCIVWAYDNSERARRYSDPGTRIRKWLEEEDVDRLIRAVEGQWKAARRVEMSEESRRRGEGEVAVLDPLNVDEVLEHFRKVFGMFREFIRKNSEIELNDSDWGKLEEAIRKEPAAFAEGNDFGVLYEFFNICLV